MFNLQIDKRDILVSMVEKNHKQEIESGIAKGYAGFNDLFRKLYPILTEREKELHMLIRGLSESLMKINEEIRDWLGKDYILKILEIHTKDMKDFEKMLEQLRKHLNGLFAVYKGMFLNDTRNSLIYASDEWENAPASLLPTSAVISLTFTQLLSSKHRKFWILNSVNFIFIIKNIYRIFN
ncbi:hypothetical protein LCGC14_0610760 [marine sediment metagenome]|uniref:Uncharacterized protein n=1 Tax=marine sediment metagenome TaxID=412755 RepID=A0A0F9TU11_9ZZZZ